MDDELREESKAAFTLLARVDKIEFSQVDTGERLALNTTVLHFLLRQTQMKDLQSVLDLNAETKFKINHSKKK